MQITSIEKKILISMYHGSSKTEAIANDLNMPYKRVKNAKNRILKKLNVNNWYNAIRVSFEKKILNKNEYNSLDIIKEVRKTSLKINNIDYELINNDHKIKLIIYKEIIEFYNKLEYNVLLKRF
jgi:hypothetical protein